MFEEYFYCYILEDLSKQQKSNFTGGKAEANIGKNRFPNKLPSMISYNNHHLKGGCEKHIYFIHSDKYT